MHGLLINYGLIVNTFAWTINNARSIHENIMWTLWSADSRSEQSRQKEWRFTTINSNNKDIAKIDRQDFTGPIRKFSKRLQLSSIVAWLVGIMFKVLSRVLTSFSSSTCSQNHQSTEIWCPDFKQDIILCLILGDVTYICQYAKEKHVFNLKKKHLFHVMKYS